MGVTPLFCSLLCHLGLNLMLRLISLLCNQTLVLMRSMNVESKKKKHWDLKYNFNKKANLVSRKKNTVLLSY